MVTTGRIPIYVRIGDGDEFEAGAFEPKTTTEAGVVKLHAELDRPTVAEALRRAADLLDPPANWRYATRAELLWLLDDVDNTGAREARLVLDALARHGVDVDRLVRVTKPIGDLLARHAGDIEPA